MFTYLTQFVRLFYAEPVKMAVGLALLMLIGGILLASFVRWLRRRSQDRPETWAGLVTTSMGNVLKVLVGLIVLAGLAMHLRYQSTEFGRLRGGTSQRNYEAVTKIWGQPHVQNEFGARLVRFNEKYFDKDGLEFDAEKLKASSQPIAFRQQKVEEAVAGNPVVEASHDVRLAMNYRRKGNASYPGFEVDCKYTYLLENASGKDVTAVCVFPLPAGQGLVDKMTVVVDGTAMHDQALSGESLTWQMPMAKDQKKRLEVSYHSRGLEFIRLDPGAGRQLRKYGVRMTCQGVRQADLNYPIGCMTPTVQKDQDGAAVLEWNLDNAVTRLGMGVILPKEKQEGYYVAKVLDAAAWALVLLVGMVLVTYVTTGRSLHYGPLVMLAVAFDLYFLLMAYLADYWPGLAGGVIISGVALTALTAWLQLRSVDRFAAWATVGFFVLLGMVYPLIVISDYEGLLTTILYVALLAYATALLVLPRLRVNGKAGS